MARRGGTFIVFGITGIALGIIIKLLSFLWWLLVLVGALALLFGLVQAFTGQRGRA